MPAPLRVYPAPASAQDGDFVTAAVHLPSWAADTLTAIAVTGFTWGWTFLATVDWAHRPRHHDQET